MYAYLRNVGSKCTRPIHLLLPVSDSFKVSLTLERKSDKSCARLSLEKITVGNNDYVQSRLVLFKIVK